MNDKVKILGRRLAVYIFVSTDSVYEVCSKKKDSSFLVEEDAKRPETKELYDKFKRKDKYGHKKLKCEEYLDRKSKELGFSFASLRLCDVVGPYDDTSRFWSTYLWQKYAPDVAILESKSLDEKISITFSHDAVNSVLFSLRMLSPSPSVPFPSLKSTQSSNSPIVSQSSPSSVRKSFPSSSKSDRMSDQPRSIIVNIACHETITLRDFLTKIKRFACNRSRSSSLITSTMPLKSGNQSLLKSLSTNEKLDPKALANSIITASASRGGIEFPYYPSVTRGPVSCAHAISMSLRLEKNVDSGVQTVCEFFNTAEKEYGKELQAAVKNLPRTIRNLVRMRMQKLLECDGAIGSGLDSIDQKKRKRENEK
mmetsp:Transcript_12345/g.18415  ORF Transcript_12345/g.18415 Transcript_12345/m.18415 type:complete len:367 (+) Transcript_12345:480-1580(+)